MLTDIDQARLTYQEAEKLRDGVIKEIQAVSETLFEAFQNGTATAKLSEISTLENKLNSLNAFIRTQREQEEKIRIEKMKAEMEMGISLLGAAQETEAALLKDLDQILLDLENKWRELLILRTKTIAQIDHITPLKNEAGRSFARGKTDIGKIGWDVKRFCDTYNVIRGRSSIFTPPAEWK